MDRSKATPVTPPLSPVSKKFRRSEVQIKKLWTKELNVTTAATWTSTASDGKETICTARSLAFKSSNNMAAAAEAL